MCALEAGDENYSSSSATESSASSDSNPESDKDNSEPTINETDPTDDDSFSNKKKVSTTLSASMPKLVSAKLPDFTTKQVTNAAASEKPDKRNSNRNLRSHAAKPSGYYKA